MKKVMLNIGVFSAFVFIIGAIFKLMHWPGAGIMLLLPIVIISFIFLPLLFLIKSKEIKENREKLTLGVGVLFGIILSLSGLFKVMHWPGAHVLWISALAMLFLVFLPFHFFGGIRNPETKTNTIISSILILMTGGLFFTLTDLSHTRHKIEELTIQTDSQLLVTTNYLHEGNQISYSVETDSIQILKSNKLQAKCDTLCAKIENLKLGLMTALPAHPSKMTEEEFIDHYGYDIIGAIRFLFTEKDENPKPNLIAIKEGINDLNSFLNLNYGSEASDLLNTEDKYNPGSATDQKVSWEIANFHRVPVQLIMRILNQLILEIKIIESSHL